MHNEKKNKGILRILIGKEDRASASGRSARRKRE
jgi:hypothetical protein